MTKKKICFIANNLTVGGVSNVLIRLCNRLNSKQYDIHLILLSDDLSMEKILPLKGHIKKHIIPYEFDLDYSLKGYLKSAYFNKGTEVRAANILKKINEINPNILHFHTLPRQLKIGQIAKANHPRLKLIFTDHLVRFTTKEYKKHQYLLLALAYKKYYKGYNLVSVSKAVQKHLNKFSIPDNSKQHLLLENTIDTSNYKRKIPLEDLRENCVVYVSRINHHKGQNTLITAWLKFHHPEKGKLLIIGPDESNGKIQKMAMGDPTILFLGSVPNVIDYLNRATLAIFPSQKEGLPIALLEKMALALPLIVSDIPELTTIIEDKKEGLHFKLDDQDDLANKIKYALNHKSEMKKYAEMARKKVEDICSKNDPIKFHNQLYSQLMSK
jgi:glycosyltransferase involved in cell wall biosynthesis